MQKRTCAHPEVCGEPVIARGLCTKHYQREKSAGNLAPLPPKDCGTCPVDVGDGLCGLPVRAKGLCNGHYKRMKDTGDVQAGVPIQKKRRGRTEKCGHDGCEETYMAGGLCKKHYAEEREERLRQLKCKNEQCGNPRGNTAGYCPACYNRFREYGDPNAGPPRRRRKVSSQKVGTRSEYHVNHQMVRKERGPAWQQTCEDCGASADQWAQIHGSAGDSPDHYKPLCRRCHAIYDDFAARLPDNRGSKRTPESRKRISEALLNRSPEAKAITREKMRQAATLREARKRQARSA